jgi:glycine/D-amino acid oxidase-like deaminating enzyme
MIIIIIKITFQDCLLMNTKNPKFDVVIVGAGAAGVGCGVVLKDLGIENFVILERHQVGASFSFWPQEMRFITPSFPSHGGANLSLNVWESIPLLFKLIAKQGCF